MDTAQVTRALRHQAGRAKRLLQRAVGNPPPDAPLSDPFPLHGWADNRTDVPLIERLDDAQLEELNRLLPWKMFTVDRRGRRFGDRRGATKNHLPRPIPDSRVTLADTEFGLAGKRVLEVGCFEGGHTIGLCRLAAAVTAVDARVVNVVKTMVRCSFYGEHPTVMVCDLETWDPAEFDADVVFHVGVLYHLRDPVRHLLELGRVARHGVLLDTHVTEEEGADRTYTCEANGKSYRYRWYDEFSHLPAAGMYDHAKFLRLPDLLDALSEAGFDGVEVVDTRPEKAGPRVTILARKPG